MLSCFSCVWLSATLWTIVCQTPLSMGFSRQEYWSGLPCPLPGDLPDPGIKPTSLQSPTLGGVSLPLVPPGKPMQCNTTQQIKRNQLLIHTTTWINLKIVMPNERSQIQKVTYSMIPFIWHSWKETATVTRTDQGFPRVMGEGKLWLHRDSMSFGTWWHCFVSRVLWG